MFCPGASSIHIMYEELLKLSLPEEVVLSGLADDETL